MNWKQFLKPDWRKIVLTIILFGWFFFGFLTGGSEGEMGIFTIIGIIGLFVSLPSLYILSHIPIIDIFGEKEGQIIFFIIYFILIGVYSYLLSCLIFWIYDFSKRKSEKKLKKKGFLERWEEKHKDLTGFISLITDFFAHGDFYMAFILFGIVLLGIFRLFLIILIMIIILIVYLILKLRSKKKTDSL